MATRIEHDLLGDRDIPNDKYYGVHTLRALENFPITGTPISVYPQLINALALRSNDARSTLIASTSSSTRSCVAMCSAVG